MSKYIAPIKLGEDGPDNPSLHEERIVTAATHLAHAITVQQLGFFDNDGMHGDPVAIAKQELLHIFGDVYSMASLKGPDYVFYDFEKQKFGCTQDIFESRVNRDISAFIGELTVYIECQRSVPLRSEGGGLMY